MANPDPCEALRKLHYEAQNELKKAEKAFNEAIYKEVVPLRTEIIKTNSTIQELKKQGDPKSEIPDLEELVKALEERLKKAANEPEVANASTWFNSAKEVERLRASDLKRCEKEHERPPANRGGDRVVPDAPAPGAGGRSSASTSGAGGSADEAGREHRVGKCWCGKTHPDHIWFEGPCWCGKEGIHNVGTGRE